MTRNFKKKMSLVLAFSMAFSIFSSGKIHADFKQGEIKQIDITVDDLIVGEDYPKNGVPIIKSNPHLPNFDSSNTKDPLQLGVEKIREYRAKVVIIKSTGELANKDKEDPSLYYTNNMNKRELKKEYEIITKPILEAAKLNEDGSIKRKSNGEFELKQYYFDPAKYNVELSEKVHKNRAYILLASLAIPINLVDKFFDERWFSNELTNRTIIVDGRKDDPAPKITLNNQEVYLGHYVPTDQSIPMGAFPIGNNKATGDIIIYSKETTSPILNIDKTENINSIQSSQGENIKSVFKNHVDNFKNIYIPKDKESGYYIKEAYIVSSELSSSNWKKVTDTQEFSLSEKYALKLVVSPKVSYKFNLNQPSINGSITDETKIELSRENEDIAVFIEYDNINYTLKNNDLSVQTAHIIDGQEIPFDEKPVVLKGNEYVDFSNVTYYKLNGKELDKNFSPNEKFDKDKKYKLAIKVNLKKGIKVDKNDLPKLMLNAQENKLVTGEPFGQNEYGILSDIITPESVIVDEVSISPENPNITTGSQLQFKSVVKGQNISNQDVVWSISGQETSETNISTDGLLKVGSKESAKTIQVMAKSVIDNSKFGKTMVKIENPYTKSSDNQSNPNNPNNPKKPNDPPMINSYTLKFTNNITAMVDDTVINSGSKVEENKKVKLTFNIPSGKEIKSFKINEIEKKDSLGNQNIYEFIIDKDTDVILELKDKKSTESSENNSSKSGSSRSSGSSSSANKIDKNKEETKKTPDIKPKKETETKKNQENKISIEKSTQIVNSFVDTKEITWSKKAIINAISNGFMAGYPDNSFRPREQLTRAQAAQVLSNILGTQVTKTAKFTDVDSNSWYFNAVNKVVEKGIFKGYEDGTFMPQVQITRNEIFVAIAKLKDISPLEEKQANEVLSKYQDVNQIPMWSKGYISALVKENIISGNDNKIDSNSKLTREQLAVILYKISNK